jgi:hypothetical protein
MTLSIGEVVVGGVENVNTAAVGNVGTGMDDLTSYTIPASRLAVNGQSVWFEFSGLTANNVNPKTVQVVFGSTTLASWTLPTSSTSSWVIRGRIIRTGAATQKAYVSMVNRSAAISSVSASVAETLSGALVLKVQGEATSNNDITCETFMVGFDENNT